VALLRSGAAARTPDAQLIRPPGVADEADFLSRCLRCSQCMKVCPTAGLQPAGLEAGLEAVWTPRLVPRLGDCDYGCNACGQVCPSHAIPALELPAKRQAVLGVAVIDHDRCLPWAEGVPCIVCEEMCPTPRKAIRLEEVDVSDTQGQPVTVQRPIVMPDLCIGCGTCEYQCPRTGPAAIRVYRA
jgi:MauM/NapG family ferredoxin protein